MHLLSQIMSVRIKVKDSAQCLHLLFDLMDERSDTTCKDVEDRALDVHFFAVLDRSFEREQIVDNSLCRSDVRDLYVKIPVHRDR